MGAARGGALEMGRLGVVPAQSGGCCGRCCFSSRPRWRASTVDGVRNAAFPPDVQLVDYPTVQAVQFMGQSLYRQSGGKLAIQVYSAALLGTRPPAATDPQRESWISTTGAQALEDIFPADPGAVAAFLVRDVDHLNWVLDGPIGAELLEAMNGKGWWRWPSSGRGVRSARSASP